MNSGIGLVVAAMATDAGRHLAFDVLCEERCAERGCYGGPRCPLRWLTLGQPLMVTTREE